MAKFKKSHVLDLRKSGLNNKMILAMGVYSVTAAGLAAELGRLMKGVVSALMIPYPPIKGTKVTFKRAKLFPPVLNQRGHKMRYAQAKASGVHLYVLPAVAAVLNDPTVPLYWTEGEKKAAKATQEGFYCVGLGGLWNWLKKGTAEGIAEIDAINHVDREEFIVPDSDVWTRPDLLRAVYALGKELEDRGATVRVVMLNVQEHTK